MPYLTNLQRLIYPNDTTFAHKELLKQLGDNSMA